MSGMYLMFKSISIQVGTLFLATKNEKSYIEQLL